MAHSVVGICNAALIPLGADTIMSLTEDSAEAKLCHNLYETVRDEVLSAFPWACALTRASLARSSAAPVFGFSHRYALPFDCLRVVQMQDQELYPWREAAGRALETDAETCRVLYIAKISDVNAMPPLLRAAISARLSYEISFPLTGSAGQKELAQMRYNQAMADAAAEDSSRQSMPVTGSSPFLEARE
jgi:hypothetical protein